jgi:hypothetical protein
MITLYTGQQRIGQISSEQFEALQNLLEEEGVFDADYYMDEATVQYLEENGVDPFVAGMLRQAIGSTGGTDVRWVKE